MKALSDTTWSPHRNPLGVLTLLSFPPAVIAYLTWHHGLEVRVAAGTLVALYFLAFVPGYLVQCRLFRVRCETPFETMLSSLLLGLFVTPLIWYVLCWLGLSAVFFPLILGVGLLVPVTEHWHHGAAARLKRLVAPADAPILWVALLLMVVWSYELSLVEVRDGRAYTIPFKDLLFHGALVSELSRGVPPEAFPFVASVKYFAYHHMPDVWCDMMRRAVGADPSDAYYHIALPLRYLFIAFGGYLLLVRRFGRPAAVVGAACMLGVIQPVSYLVSGGPLILLHYGYPAGFGLVGVSLCIFYISTVSPKRPRGPLLLASVMSVLLLWYKANFALPLAPAVCIFTTVILVKRGDYRWLMLCIASMALAATVRYVQLAAADMRYTLVFAPLAYLRWEWMGMVLPAAVKTALHHAVGSMPQIIAYPTIFVIWLTYRYHVGIVVIWYLIVRCGFARSRHRAAGVDKFMLLVLTCSAVGYLLFPVQKDVVSAVAETLRILLNALLLVLMGPAICYFLQRTILRTRAAIAITLTALALAFVANAFALHHKALHDTRWPTDFGSDHLYACYQFIESSTPADSVILQPRPLGCEVGALTQRRGVLQGYTAWRSMVSIQPIAEDVAQFYNGPSRVEARSILERYKVDYVIADNEIAHLNTPQILEEDSWLKPIYQSGGVIVYRVERAGRFTSTPWPTGDTHSATRCGGARS